jgi:hypothetical protein
MAKISSIKRFFAEDFPAPVRVWISDKLLVPLNQFIDQSVSTLNGGITYADNLKCKRYDIVIAASQMYPIKLRWDLNERPNAVYIAQFVPQDNSTPSAAVSLFWLYDANQISITLIGLDAAKKYNIRLIAQV